jgi:hypothetical protein
MSLQEGHYDERNERRGRRTVYIRQITKTVSGSAGTLIGSTSNSERTVVSDLANATTTQGYQLVCDSTATKTEEYAPEMVELLLRLDTEKPEAKFNNVVDMLDWLNRE